MSKAPASTKLVLTLAGGMLLFGTSTSLWMKFQDLQCVQNCDDPDSRKRKNFEQPIVQSLVMFMGETLCLLASLVLAWTRLSRTIPPGPPLHAEAPPLLEENAPEPVRPMRWSTRLLFAGPATCDILGTTSMNAALLWTSVSVYQMLKGALTLWVAFFSIIFLGRRLVKSQWFALAAISLGVGIVGFVNYTANATASEAGQHPVLGVVIILLAQVFIATQFVIEEKLMEKYRIEPLTAVGYEGVSGIFLIACIVMPLGHLLIGRTEAGRGGFFDAPNAIHELIGSGIKIWGPAIIFAISVAGVNAFGLAVTNNVSATARSTIDTCRTISIWVVSLALGWETFEPLQLVGFIILAHGTLVFNGIITYPAWTGLRDESILAGKTVALDGESAPLLREE